MKQKLEIYVGWDNKTDINLVFLTVTPKYYDNSRLATLDELILRLLDYDYIVEKLRQYKSVVLFDGTYQIETTDNKIFLIDNNDNRYLIY